MRTGRSNIGFLAALVLATLAGFACGHKYDTIDARYIEDSEYRLTADLDRRSAAPTTAEDSLLALESAPNGKLINAVTLYQQGQFDRAAEILKKLLAGNEREWRAAYFLGLVETCQRQFDRADLHLNQSLNNCPPDDQLRALVYTALGKNAENQGNLGRARQHFLTALYLNPRSFAANDGIKRLKMLARDDR